MTSSVNYSISGNLFQNNLGESLSRLQQNQELVDMTLAADGHLVKVHQLVLALASPYLKQLITSTPSQHPIIFLNNVSSQNLCLLLEYMYSGETIVPEECMHQFISIGKILHIRGLEDLKLTKTCQTTERKISTGVERVECNPIKRVKQTKIDSSSGIKKLSLSGVNLKKEVTVPALATNIKVRSLQTKDEPSISQNSESLIVLTKSLKSETIEANSNDDDDDCNNSFMEVTESAENETAVQPTTNDKSIVQFTLSERKSLQVILNRYIYNFSSHKSSGVRRWRCIDYRPRKCLAFVTTRGNMVLSRCNMHNHSFHDKKILAKIKQKSIFTDLDEVVAEERKANNERGSQSEK